MIRCRQALTWSSVAFVVVLSTQQDASAADDLIAPGSGQRQLISLGHSNVLEWVPVTGAYRVWKYDRTSAGDPLPGSALVTGSWLTLRTGHQLVYLGSSGVASFVLDWEPFTCHYRVWLYNSLLLGNVDPFSNLPLTEGNWGTIKTGHQLISLEGNRVLDWESATGTYRVWNFDPSASGSADPFPGNAVSSGVWSSVRTGERLIYLGNDRVLAFHASTGNYRVWSYDRNAPFGVDPLPSPAITEGHWNSIGVGQELISVEPDRILAWQRATGFVRNYWYNIAAQTPVDPLPDPMVSIFTWQVLRSAMPVVATQSLIHRVVLIVQENHTFDSYFGRYCTAPTSTSPSCTTGPACCQAGPCVEPHGSLPVMLDDAENGAYGPPHKFNCEASEINDGGVMDRFASGSPVPGCSNPKNFAYAWNPGLCPNGTAPICTDGIQALCSDGVQHGKISEPALNTYWGYAQKYAMTDQYFQPTIGASYDNDVYFAKAGYVSQDNAEAGIPSQVGVNHIGAVLAGNEVSWASYLENRTTLLAARDDPFFPFDPPRFDDPNLVWDRPFAQFTDDLAAGTLPRVSIIKATNDRSEHPGAGDAFPVKISDGITFVNGVVNAVLGSQYANDTLILFTYDEGGGYYDHVSPPMSVPLANDSRPGAQGSLTVPYGTRLPFLAIGHFAKKNYISHTVMEHSSIVRFLEWNYGGGITGQLGRRDAVVHGLGSLLDPTFTGVPVPQ